MSWWQKLLVAIVKRWAPQLVAQLLTSIDPEELADRIKPYIVSAMLQMPIEWQKNFVLALRKLAEFVSGLVPDEGATGGQ